MDDLITTTSAATTTAGLEVEIGGLEFWIFSKL